MARFYTCSKDVCETDKSGMVSRFWSRSGKNDVPINANEAYLEFSFRYNISKTVKHLAMYGCRMGLVIDDHADQVRGLCLGCKCCVQQWIDSVTSARLG